MDEMVQHCVRLNLSLAVGRMLIVDEGGRVAEGVVLHGDTRLSIRLELCAPVIVAHNEHRVVIESQFSGC